MAGKGNTVKRYNGKWNTVKRYSGKGVWRGKEIQPNGIAEEGYGGEREYSQTL